MNNNTHSLPIESEHPLPGGGIVLLAPQPETETRKAEGVNSNGPANSSPHGPAGSGAFLPRLIRRIKPLSGGVLGKTAPEAPRGDVPLIGAEAHLLSAAAWKIADTLEADGWEKSPLSTQPPSATPEAGRSGNMEDAFRRMPSRSRSSDRPALNPSPACGGRKADSTGYCSLNLAGLRACLFSLALLATPAAADTCSYGNGAIATTVSIAPGDESFAVVTIDNKLAHRARSHCDLTLFGVTVTVEYDPGSGALPDWFRVTVPRGFVAVPPEILIDDRDQGKVLIVLERGLGA